MEAADQRIMRWEKRFNAQQKMDDLGAATVEKVKAFGDKHPKLRDSTVRIMDKTQKMLLKIEHKATKITRSLEKSDAAKAVMSGVNKIRAKFATVTQETDRLCTEQEHQDAN